MTYLRQRNYDLEEGRQEGRNEKSIEAAVVLVKKYKASPETAASDVGAPLEKVLEALKVPANV